MFDRLDVFARRSQVLVLGLCSVLTACEQEVESASAPEGPRAASAAEPIESAQEAGTRAPHGPSEATTAPTSEPVDPVAEETDRLTAAVDAARESLTQRSKAAAAFREAVVREAKVEAVSKWPLLAGRMEGLDEYVAREGDEGSLLYLGIVVKETKENPSLWDFTDDVKAFHGLCVARYDAKQEVARATRELHEHRMVNDAEYAASVAAEEEALRAEGRRIEAERLAAERAAVMQDHEDWLATVTASSSVAALANQVGQATKRRREQPDLWSEDQLRQSVVDAFEGTLLRIAGISDRERLSLCFQEGTITADDPDWVSGVQRIGDETIQGAKRVAALLADVNATAPSDVPLLTLAFWEAVEATQAELEERARARADKVAAAEAEKTARAAAKAAEVAAAKDRYHTTLRSELAPLTSVAALNALTRRIKEEQAAEPAYWEPADLEPYVAMQNKALQELLGWQGKLSQPIKTLMSAWSWRNDKQARSKWTSACKAIPEGEAEAMKELLSDGCLAGDLDRSLDMLPTRAKDAEYWTEVIAGRSE